MGSQESKALQVTAKTDQTSRMHRLIWVLAGLTCNLIENAVSRLTCNRNYQYRISSVVDEYLPWIKITMSDPVLMQVVDPYQKTSRDELSMDLA